MRRLKKAFFSTILLSLVASSFCWGQDKFNEEDYVIIPKTEYVIGEGFQSYTEKRTVNEFSIYKYETTYNLWYKILNQAKELGYTFQNLGQEGSEGRYGRLPTDIGFGQPVTMISWYDAIVWCNAYSEIKGLTPCYTYKGNVLKDSTNTAMCDLSQCNFFSDGYRLPTEAEWELAARLKKDGKTATGGKISRKEDSMLEDDFSYGWTSENASSTHKVGTAGSLFSDDTVTIPGSGNSNEAGIFDMTGNVLEYCWDWYANYSIQEPGKISSGPEYGSKRVSRGGSWSEYTMFTYTADRYSYDPNECYNYMGFRIVQSR